MKEKTSLIFTGDIGFDRYMDKKWEDEELLSKEVLDYLHSADHVIANVEGPLVRQETNTATEGVQQLLHTMNPEATKVLRNMHADIWNLCNNHMMDAGDMGVECTLREAREFGALTVGAGMNHDEASRPIYLDEAGGIGIFSVGYRRGCKPAGEDKAGCLLWNELDVIQKNIDEIKEKCRWCVIVAHGGEEFTSLPSPYTRDRYHMFLDMGADIIVAHHPHVPMNYETVGDKVIFYSLGNFIFDTDYQRAQFNTEKGLLVKLDFTEDSYSYEGFGLKIERGPEHVVHSKLPDIFEDVQPEEYELLAPLAAKMFVAATKRQQIYLNKAEYENADEAKWAEHFANPKRSGRVEGEALDFFIICPLAEREKEKAWERSKLDKVKEYILAQM
ncbi:MAG: CapA family protein [Lachnospiraceae bacterium]|nr:CapA family protein [Lachnospiraceae bacterium]